MTPRSHHRPLLPFTLFVAAALLAACAPMRTASEGTPPAAPQNVLRAVAIDRVLEDRVMALDPERVSADDVRNTLSKAPAPRIILVHGGIYPVYLAMISTGRFLAEMGYPEQQIREPGSGEWSHSPYEDTVEIAGLIAWHYEREGLRPMLIGHSQGGVQVVRVLYELTGRLNKSVPVWNPLTGNPEARTTIVDPLTGRERPVVGLSVSYVSAIGAGGSMLLLPNQWTMMDKLYTIPNNVDEFTGYSMELDFIAFKGSWASTPGGGEGGKPEIRNVLLPLGYNHLTTPFVQGLAENAAARAWIDAYVPDGANSAPPPDTMGYAAVWAADVWHSVKKHWVLELKRLIEARRGAPGRS